MPVCHLRGATDAAPFWQFERGSSPNSRVFADGRERRRLYDMKSLFGGRDEGADIISVRMRRPPDKVCDLASRKSPTVASVRAGGVAEVPENAGGKGGTRTLDPGIMSAVL